MVNILIIGAGVFGARAAVKLREQNVRITVVDSDPDALSRLHGEGLSLLCSDAATVLADNHTTEQFDYIVPAVPFHVALCWLTAKMEAAGRVCRRLEVPVDLPVPNPYYLQGTVYSSFAVHLCPEDCPEPTGWCYTTGEERRMPLYRLLASLSLPGYTVAVLQSRQLAPGVGGLKTEDLAGLFQRLQQIRGQLLLATACSCHAVVDALHIE